MPKVASQVLGFATREARRRPTAESLVAVSRAIGEGLELATLLRRTAHHVGRALAADETIVWWIDASDERLKPVSRIDPLVWSGVALLPREVPGRSRLVQLHPTTSSGRPGARAGARVNRQPMKELLRRSIHRTMLVVPFRVNDLMSGALTLFWSDGRRQPIREEVALAEAAVRQVGTAVGYAELLLQLQGAREQLQSLSRDVEHVREHERARIAREIHDELGHALTNLKVDLARRTHQDTPPQDRQTPKTLPAAVDGLIESARRIAHQLHPHVLDDLGLVAALEWQAQDFVRRTGVRCRFRCRGTPSHLDAECSTTLFRIFQEIMTNIARQAEASRVQIMLTVSRTAARLEVHNNGSGLVADSTSAAPALAAFGMQERATALGGRVEVSSNSEQGTKVQVWIPLKNRRPAVEFR